MLIEQFTVRFVEHLRLGKICELEDRLPLAR